MNRTIAAVCLIGAAGTAAYAQPTWATQAQFRQGTAGAIIVGGTMPVTAVGLYTFTVQVGIFNLTGLSQGEANFGVGTWNANVTSTGLNPNESLGVVATNARVSPFNFGPATSFGGIPVGPAINSVSCMRDLSGGASAPWLWDSDLGQPGPQPTAPTNPSPGAGSFANVWRFQVNITSVTGADIVIHFDGHAGPVIAWSPVGSQAPNDIDSGSVTFAGATPVPPLLPYSATLTLTRSCGAPFAFTSHPVPQSVVADAPVFFAVTTSATVGNPTYQWRRNGVNITNNGRIAGANGPVLMISPVIIGDEGAYDVVATDPCTAVLTSSAAQLNVSCPADADRNGSIQPADIGVFVANWFSALASGGC